MFSLVDISLRPSLYWRGCLCCIHVCALFAIGYAALPFFTQFILSLMIILSAWFSCFSLQDSISQLHWDVAEDQLRLKSGGQWLTVESVSLLWPNPYLIYFDCRVEQRLLPLRLVVCRDSTAAASFRRLSVAARLAALPGSKKPA